MYSSTQVIHWSNVILLCYFTHLINIQTNNKRTSKHWFGGGTDPLGQAGAVSTLGVTQSEHWWSQTRSMVHSRVPSLRRVSCKLTLTTQPPRFQQTHICWRRRACARGGGSSKTPAKPRSQSERAWTTAGAAGATPASSPQTWRQLQSNTKSRLNDDWGACPPLSAVKWRRIVCLFAQWAGGAGSSRWLSLYAII